jgi:uncharacterized protein YbjT (DUF2867 family)
MKYVIIGATGLVGNQFIMTLLERNEEVIAISRKKIEIHNKLFKNLISPNILDIDFNEIQDCDVIISALGTTIKKAKTKENFKAIDYTLVKDFINKFPKSKTVILISALGANSNSSIFYNKIKGELEDTLKSFNFKRLIIVRPSLLIGAREEQRPLEAIAQSLLKHTGKITPKSLKKYAPHDINLVVNTALDILNNNKNNIIQTEDITCLVP